jgi:hypothetical protein
MQEWVAVCQDQYKHFRQTHSSYVRPTHMIKHGLMGATWKKKKKATASPQKARQVHSIVKSLLCFLMLAELCIWSSFHRNKCESTFLHRYSVIPVGRCLHPPSPQTWTEKWSNEDWILHCNNNSVYSVFLVQEFLARNSITFILHPLVSLCLAQTRQHSSKTDLIFSSQSKKN